ncbi:MAG TPA: hypothetical protein VMP01_25915 [Pirellulaceae bacterium]|nr:hypothetical protein [Pirellulaceae bacterium]
MTVKRSRGMRNGMTSLDGTGWGRALHAGGIGEAGKPGMRRGSAAGYADARPQEQPPSDGLLYLNDRAWPTAIIVPPGG